jgi:hypothetical protein
MMETALPIFEIPELRTDFVFRRRPLAIPGDLRPAWRIGLVVLLLKNCCRGGKSSLGRLHVLSWGFRTRQSQHDLKAAAEGAIPLGSLIVRFDPFLDRAVDFAVGENLLTHIGGRAVELTASGRQLATEVESNDSLFEAEKSFILLIRRNVTEQIVDQMFRWR